MFIAIWTSIFSNVLSKTKDSGNQTDSLSGGSFNKTAVNSDRGTNPVAPYFVGFDQLTARGMTNEVLIYTKDVLTNYALYDREVVYGKISYINNSLKGPKIEGDTTSYVFDIGINDAKNASVTVSSGFLSDTKTISVKPFSATKSFVREFNVVAQPTNE